MRPLFISSYRVLARLLGGTGISQVYPFNRIERWFLSRTRGRTASIDGHTIYLDEHDSLNLSVLGVNEPFTTQLIRDLIPAGGVAVDIGANIGYYTLLMARTVGPEGRVIAFEPDAENARILRKNLEANGYSNVTVVEAAVAEAEGVVRLHLADGNSVNHRLSADEDGRATVEIPAVTLDEWLAVHDITRVDFIKLDIEGAETRALAGMKHTFLGNPQLRMILEFSPYNLHQCGASPDTYFGLLSAMGLSIAEIEEHAARMVPVSPEDLQHRYTVRNEKLTNLLVEHQRVT